jgi:hypothetical protein
MSAITLAIFEVYKKYKNEQKFFTQWVTKTITALDVRTTTLQTHSEAPPEPSIQKLQCMADSIALHIQQTEHDALKMVVALLAGRRECAALFRALSLEDGQDRSEKDATHLNTIEEFQRIYDTLQSGLAFAAPKKTFSPPIAKHSNPTDGNKYTILGDSGSRHANDMPISSEQGCVLSTASSNTTSTSPRPDYESTVMRSLETLAPIRRTVRATWGDYQAGKSDLYEATEITRHAFALSLGVVAELNATPTESELLLECFVRLSEGSQELAAKSDPNDFCYARASGLLALLCEHIDLENSKSDDASARREELTERCKNYHPLASHLCVLVGRLPQRAKGPRKGLALYERTDPLLLMLLGLCRARKATLEATVVVQLYLELYEAAEMPTRRHTDALKEAAKATKRSLTALSSAARQLEKQTTSRELMSEPGQACRSIADEVISLGEAESKLAKGDASSRSILLFFLVNFPFLCGTIYTSMANNFYLDGIQMTRYESRVTTSAHLHRATGFTGRSETWTQLQVFQNLQGKATLGFADVDEDTLDPFEVAIELILALGIPRTDFEEFKLKNHGLARRLPLPYVVNVDALALLVNKHSLLSLEQGATSNSDRARVTSPLQSRRTLQLLADVKMRKQQMAAAESNMDSSVKREDRFSPAQLLQTLSETLAADMPHLKFGYHGLTLACWELNHTIAQNYRRELRESHEYLFNGARASGKFNVMDEVLWECVAIAQLAQDDETHPGNGDSMLFKLVPAFEKFIKRLNEMDS